MKREEFEALTVEEVREKADAEGPQRPGMPEWFDRPWSQLLDELPVDAKTVADLRPNRIEVFRKSTGAVYGQIGPDLSASGGAEED